MPWRVSLPQRLAGLASKLRNRITGKGSPLGEPPIALRLDPLLQAGITLREAREAHGYGLRQLAQNTRISTAVLEAMERGWRDRLPEAAYLRTMLPLLERHLLLPNGSLDGALPPLTQRASGQQRVTLLRRFTPGSIDVFTTWQGTLLYGVLTLGLIYALNLQQQRLAARGLLSTRPMIPLTNDSAANAADTDDLLLRAFPDLRPLKRAAAGQGLRLLLGETSRRRGEAPIGLLRLSLPSPTRVRLRSGPGRETTLSEVTGELTLSLRQPFRLTLSPRAAGQVVSWNGRTLLPRRGSSPEAGDPAVTDAYVYPPAAAPAAATPSGRPETLPAPRP
jgi:hypothetical protein